MRFTATDRGDGMEFEPMTRGEWIWDWKSKSAPAGTAGNKSIHYFHIRGILVQIAHQRKCRGRRNRCHRAHQNRDFAVRPEGISLLPVDEINGIRAIWLAGSYISCIKNNRNYVTLTSGLHSCMLLPFCKRMRTIKNLLLKVYNKLPIEESLKYVRKTLYYN